MHSASTQHSGDSIKCRASVQNRFHIEMINLKKLEPHRMFFLYIVYNQSESLVAQNKIMAFHVYMKNKISNGKHCEDAGHKQIQMKYKANWNVELSFWPSVAELLLPPYGY